MRTAIAAIAGTMLALAVRDGLIQVNPSLTMGAAVVIGVAVNRLWRIEG